MGRSLGGLVLLVAFTACDADSARHPVGPGSGGSGGSGGSDANGDGGTGAKGNPDKDQGTTGVGGRDSNGDSGTTAQGQGGSTTQGQGGSTTQGQGGTVGSAGSAGIAGEQGSAGFAGYHAGPCEDDCEPCAHDNYVFTVCEDNRCVCEIPDKPLKEKYEELLACYSEEPCPPSTQYSDPGTFRWEGATCLLTALRDRTPGKYQYTETFADAGSQTSDYTFLMDGSDEVLVLDVTTTGLVAGNLTRNVYPVYSCALKSYDELDACVAAGTDWAPTTTGGEQPVCRYSSDWFQNCDIVENPQCSAE